MKGRAILVAQIIGLSLSVILLAGCESGQQEKTKAPQEKIKAQEDEIDKLRDERKELVQFLIEYATDLEECQKKLRKVEKENEILKKVRQFTPTELQKGLAELKAAREASAKRLREEAAAEANEP